MCKSLEGIRKQPQNAVRTNSAVGRKKREKKKRAQKGGKEHKKLVKTLGDDGKNKNYSVFICLSNKIYSKVIMYDIRLLELVQAHR